jgi:hypothetical protein
MAVFRLLRYMPDPEQRDFTAGEIREAIRERARQRVNRKKGKKK